MSTLCKLCNLHKFQPNIPRMYMDVVSTSGSAGCAVQRHRVPVRRRDMPTQSSGLLYDVELQSPSIRGTLFQQKDESVGVQLQRERCPQELVLLWFLGRSWLRTRFAEGVVQKGLYRDQKR